MRRKRHWYSRFLAAIILFIIATALFGLSGPWGQLGKVSLQVYSLFSGTYEQGTFGDETEEYAEGLVPAVINVVISILAYYILAEIIFLLTGLFFRGKKKE